MNDALNIIDDLFDWAQTQYPSLFPTEAETSIYQEYQYRYYPTTDLYVGIANEQVYLLGTEQTDGEITPVGTLTYYLSLAGLPTENINPTSTPFEYAPVDLSKVEYILPMGGMIGNHITPIDHQYYITPDFGDSEAIQVDVYSPANGQVTSLQHMGNFDMDDYRIVIEHSNQLSSVYIHVDHLSDKLMTVAPSDGQYTSTNIGVTAGEIIGAYSGSVDYNIIDTDITLTGFIEPSSYTAEPWKTHTPDPFTYFTDTIQNSLIDKSLRTTEPTGGKIDHDINGRVVGNWFLEGSNGYAGLNQSNYWIGHLTFAYDYIVPDHIIASFGDYNGEPRQFGIKGNAPDPADISTSTGIIEYELVDCDYYIEGNHWDRSSLAKGMTMKNGESHYGVVLLQLVEDQKLKMELFYNQAASSVDGFTDQALYYVR